MVAGAARVSDATVTPKVSGLGLSGCEKTVEAMNIANTTTYGGFFNLPSADLYTIRVSSGAPVPRSPSLWTSSTTTGASCAPREQECCHEHHAP